MQVIVRDTAKKDIKTLDKPIAKRILLAILELENYPDTSNIKMLKNHSPSYRKRVGNYRILFEIEDKTINVYHVKHRKEAY